MLQQTLARKKSNRKSHQNHTKGQRSTTLNNNKNKFQNTHFANDKDHTI